MSLDFLFFLPEQMMEWLTAAVFHVHEAIEREPYADVEYSGHCAYIFAPKVDQG